MVDDYKMTGKNKSNKQENYSNATPNEINSNLVTGFDLHSIIKNEKEQISDFLISEFKKECTVKNNKLNNKLDNSKKRKKSKKFKSQNIN